MTKQLYKLINVIKVSDIPSEELVGRELVLVKVDADPKVRAQIIEIADIFRAKIVDVSTTTLTMEATGTKEKIHALEDLLKPFGIKEMVRTGRIALARGGRSTT